MASDADRPVIVAGVDGSQCSLEALRWAARQSELTGAEFHAVMAWSLPEIYSYTPRDFQSDARKALEDAIEQALGLGPRAPVVAQVVEGRPARGTGRGGGQRGRVGLSGARGDPVIDAGEPVQRSPQPCLPRGWPRPSIGRLPRSLSSLIHAQVLRCAGRDLRCNRATKAALRERARVDDRGAAALIESGQVA
jgi:hypothetical protein